MKQIFMLLLLSLMITVSFAQNLGYIPYPPSPHDSIYQNNWRCRNNDGGEKTATWKTAQNAPADYRAADGVVRLRIEIRNESQYQNTTYSCNGGSTPCGPIIYNISYSISDSLQYSTTPADSLSWKNIGFNPLQPFVIARDSSYVGQGDTTTMQLTGSNGYTFQPGIIMVRDSVLSQNMDAQASTEDEWSLEGTSYLIPDTTYYFRQKGYVSSETVFRRHDYSYAQYPSLHTASSVLPVTLTRFTVSSGNGNIQASWSVAPGTSSSFALQRSTDGRTWTTVQTLNANNATTYTAYDNYPPKGTLYHRLQMAGTDGSRSYSEIRQITSSADLSLASVAPNPAHDVAVLQFTGIAGTKYTAAVMDVTGNIVLRKEGIAVQGNNQLKLDVGFLTKSVYFIRLVNGDSVQNLKLVKGE